MKLMVEFDYICALLG